MYICEHIKQDFHNVHLLRYFVENAWQLPRPNVVLTFNGGAKYFDLASDYKDKIMRGVMEGTRHLKPWCACIFISACIHIVCMHVYMQL